MGKGENAGHQHFLLFPHFFQRPLIQGYFKSLWCGKELILHNTILCYNNLSKNPFQNIVGKGENAGNQHFLLFPQCFLPYQRHKL